MRLARSYTNTNNDREDLLQDIVLAIWQALPRFRNESSVKTFLFRIALNRSLTFLAQRKPVIQTGEEFEIVDSRRNPEKEFAKGQEQSRLMAAIHNLPIDYRQVITLTLEDLSYTEIADVLGISESNVGVRLNRARQMLRRLLEVPENERR